MKDENLVLHDESTREKIINAAAFLMAKEGIKGATTKEIALKASVNEVTIFKIFQTKDLLLMAVLNSLFPEKNHFAPIANLFQNPVSNSEELREVLFKTGTFFANNILEKNRNIINIYIHGGKELDKYKNILFQRLNELAMYISKQIESDASIY